MRLSKRPFRTRDTETLFAWFPTERDALQWAGAGLSWPLNKREFSKLVAQHRGTSPIREVWAVFDAEDEMIGHFQLTYNRRLNTVGLGRIAIRPDRRGEGLAAPMMDLILEKAFARDWVHRLELLVYSHNTAAIHAYQRAGFVLEGTRRETTPIAGEIWDTKIMSILRNEFDKRTERE